MQTLTNKELWLKCAEWGSFIYSGDPGACMYGFNETSGFQSRAHAEKVKRYVTEFCKPHDLGDGEDLAAITETARAFLARA